MRLQAEIGRAAATARWGAVAAMRLLGGADYVLRDAPQAVVDALAKRNRQAGQRGTNGLLDAVYDAASVEQQLRRGHHALMEKVRSP
jgi:hypothetical protein